MRKLISKFDLSYLYAFIGEGTLALTLAFYIIIARVLGPEEYGLFAAAVALAAILSLFIQFGLPTLINREIAAHPETGTRSVSLFLVLEGLLSIAVLLALLPISLFLGYRGSTILICYLAVFSEIGRAIIMTLRRAVKGLNWFRAETTAVAIERVSAVIVGTIVLFQTRDVIFVFLSIILVRALQSVGLFLFLSTRVNTFSSINWRNLLNTLKVAYPFALSGVLWILYYQVDVVMLKSLSTETETGLYSASYRILEIFSALPRVVFYVIFNRFAQYHVSDPERLPEQIFKGARLLLLVVIPAVAVAGLIQTHLIKLLYGDEFAEALRSLCILLPSLSIKMFGSLATEFLNATEREKQVPKILTIAALSNVVMNLILIPKIASPGAAIATLLSECIMATLALLILRRVGYGKASQTIMQMTCVGFVLTLIPSFIAYGLNPFVGAVLMLPCAAFLIYLIRLQNFAQTTSV